MESDKISNTTLLTTIQSLIDRFEDQRLEEIMTWIKENYDSIAFSMAEIGDCKKSVEMTKTLSTLTKENEKLKERTRELARYKRRGMEGQRKHGCHPPPLLNCTTPDVQNGRSCGDCSDSENRKEIIMQFTKRTHRDNIIKHKVCEELQSRFMKDLSNEDKLALDVLWPIIENVRKVEKAASFRGPLTFVDDKRDAVTTKDG